MNNFKNELKYQWRLLKANVKGGYQEVKKILVYEDLVEKFKEGLRVIKENNERDKQQKDYHNKEILQPNDIVEFRDPVCLGNIIKAKVIHVSHDYWNEGYVVINVYIIDDSLGNKGQRKSYYQYDILNELVNIEQPNINK